MMKFYWQLNEGDKDPALLGSSARVAGVVLVAKRVYGDWLADVLFTAEGRTADTREEAQTAAEEMFCEIIDPIVATARAEAALAEREACAEVARDLVDSDVSGYLSLGARAALSSIRARTTPATLSTETLAAIAEARGLRVVEPELLAGLEPPVLRWLPSAADPGSVASVGDWRAYACNGHWRVTHKTVADGRWIAFSRTPYNGDEAQAKRAAEAALRALGVSFVVEDGGVK